MITAENLTKRYGPKTAVDGISFTVRPGQVTGFLTSSCWTRRRSSSTTLDPGLDDEKSGANVALVMAEPPQGCHEMVRRLGRVLARVGQAGSNVASRACSAAWSGPTNGGVCGASSTVS
jgi:hypothetical protein